MNSSNMPLTVNQKTINKRHRNRIYRDRRKELERDKNYDEIFKPVSVNYLNFHGKKPSKIKIMIK